MKKRYVIYGLSVRGTYHFVLPLLGLNREGGGNYDAHAELVAIVDIDRARVENFLCQVGRRIPIYHPEEAARMFAESRPDVALIATPDHAHVGHVEQALLAGCDVIVEKPMVIDCAQARQVQAAEKMSGRKVIVAFNLRYSPVHQRLKQVIQAGELGRITSVELVYNLDEWHGSSYFYRWNRERAKSGGLCIHKCCHHFDLVNWLLGDAPETLFAFGARNYYGANGALRPRDAQGRPYSPADEKRNCPIFRKHYAKKDDPASNAITPGWDSYSLPNDAQYPPDRPRYIYDEAIDVEDTYSVVVRYRGGASLCYSCNFCPPWEGYVLGVNGTKGRAEVSNRMDPNPTGNGIPLNAGNQIAILPLFGERRIIEIPAAVGGHGGADYAIQKDLFDRVTEESRKLGLVAGSEEGAISVAMGEAVWRSIASGQPVDVNRLLRGDTKK